MLHTRTTMLAKYIRLLALLGGVCAAPAAAQQGVTNPEGRYRIDRISAGAYQVQVRLIGYAFGQQAVTVAAGETLTLDVALAAVAIPLEALVVTATGAEQRVKELGNAVTNIQASKITEEAPVNTVADLLNARAPGVEVITSGGTTGSGSRIRIRGASSLSLTNEP